MAAPVVDMRIAELLRSALPWRGAARTSRFRMRRPSLRLLCALAVLGTVAAGALAQGAGALSAQGMSPSHSLWEPPLDISVEGHRSDTLFETTTIFLSVLFAIMAGALAVAMVKFRAGRGVHAHYDRGDTIKDGLFGFVVSTLIFVVVDGNLLIRSHIDLNEVYWNYPENDPGVLKVEVLAQQWAWNFRYPGRDGEFNTKDDIVTFNDFRVPEEKKVLVQLRSKDVLHSFFLANCRIKQDANPGSTTRMWFQTRPGTAGEYEVACAEMCGFAHYMMKSRFVVLKENDWKAWVAEATRWSEIAFDETKPEQQWGWKWEVAKAR
jgi:cytochrome c oxidase subunit II